MATLLRVYDGSKQPLGMLPDTVGLTQQIAFNDVGTLTGTYPRNGVNAHLLDLPTAYLAVVEDGVEQDNWYIYEEDTDQDDSNPARDISISARSMAAMLEWALIFPQAHSGSQNPNGMDPVFKHTKKKPGYIMRMAITRAKARGALTQLDYSFTDTHDSAGVAWPTAYSITYPAGQDLLQVLMGMVESEWVDFNTDGFTLNLYVHGTALTGDAPNVIYRLGKDCQLSTRSRSRRVVRNAILGVGEEKNMLFASDVTSIAQFGRREGVASDGRMVSDGSLPQLVASTLSKSARAKEGLSLTVPVGDRGNAGEKIWRPTVDFTVGNFIRYDQHRASDSSLTPLQVKTISFTWETGGSPANCVIEFDDLFVKWSVRQTRIIRGIRGGSTNETGTLPPAASIIPDTSTPLPPGDVLMGESLVYARDEKYLAQAYYLWAPVSENTDGSDYTDHDYYQFQWQVDGGSWSQLFQTVDPEAVLQDLPPGSTIVFRVRAVDTASPPHASDWTAAAPAVMPIDDQPPPKPATPTLFARLGTVAVTYNELDSLGGTMPADYAWVKVHAAEDPNLIPDGGNEVGTILRGEQVTVVSDLPYGTHTFKLVAYDTGGNASEPSDGATIEVKSLVDTDIIGKVLDGANLIDNSVDAGLAVRAGTVTTSRLDVGALGDNKQQNPLFEEADTTDPTRPALWQIMWWGGTGGTLSFETANPIQGTRSLRITNPGPDDRTEVSIPTGIIPVNEGEQYRFKATFRASRSVVGKKAVIHAWVSQTKESNGSIFNSPESNVITVASADLTAANTTIEGTYTIPAGYKWLRLALDNEAPGDAAGGYAILWDEVVFQRRIVSAVIADGAVTTPKLAALAVQAGNVAANAITTDKLDVGAVTAEKIALGTFGTNLIYDPSFEQTYPIGDMTAPGAVASRWRYADKVGNAYVERANRPHSGLKALRLVTTASGEGIRVISGVFPVTPGKTYNVSFHVAKEVNADVSDFYCRVAGGSTPLLTEFPAGPFQPYIAFGGADPTFAEGIDPAWIGNNLYPGDLTVDSNGDGIADGAAAYTSGPASTGGTRSVSTAGQAFAATTIPDTGRWGVLLAEVPVALEMPHRVSLDYTYSGTGGRLKLYVDGVDSATGAFVSSVASTTTVAASGRLTLDLPVKAGVDGYRIYAWIENAAAGVAATTVTATVTNLQLEAVDANGLTMPAQENYQAMSGEFVAPAGINYCAIRLLINAATAAQSYFVDDVSCIEKGVGGSELTAAGLRLFGADGTEVAAFVSNRANYFSVTKAGNTLASISDDGGGSFQTVDIRGTDADGDGAIDSGFRIYGTEFLEWLDTLPRGVMVWENFVSDLTSLTTETGYGEVGFTAAPGRLYKVNVRSMIENNSAQSIVHRLRMTYADQVTDEIRAPDPKVTSPQLLQTNVTLSSTDTIANADYWFSDWTYLWNDGALPRHVRILGTHVGGGGSTTVIRSQGGGTSSITNPEGGYILAVEDVGPYRGQGGAYNTGGASAPPAPPVQTYTKTWSSTNACAYMGNGSKDSSQGSSDMKQGYSSYDGDSRSLWTFPSMTSTLAGSTITKIRVYLYANHWYYNSGGTARIKVHGHSSIPSSLGGSSPMTHAVDSKSWPKPGGRWVTLPSSLYAGFISGAYRGIGVGPAGTSNLLYYGRFNKSGAKIEVTYRK